MTDAAHNRATLLQDCSRRFSRPLRWCEVPGNLCCPIPWGHQAHPDYWDQPLQRRASRRVPATLMAMAAIAGLSVGGFERRYGR